jgi:uncharacterized protein YggE
MKSIRILWLLLVTGLCTLPLCVQAAAKDTHHLSVSVQGKVNAKADLAIVFMSVRSTAPLAADALEENNQKLQRIKGRLTALGYKDEQIRIGGGRFGPSGGGAYYAGGQRPTGFDAYNSIFIYIEGPEINDAAQFSKRVSALLDELSKEGATASNFSNVNIAMGGGSEVIYSIKDPAPYEKQATQQALDKAQPLAEEVAGRMKVNLTGVSSMSVSPAGRAAAGVPAATLDEIPYEYFSSSVDAVPVQVHVSITYTYK